MRVPSDLPFDIQGANGTSNPVTAPVSMSEAVDLTVAKAATAVDGLKDLLHRLEALAALAKEHQQNETKIGELFVRVQDYINHAMAEAEAQARNLIANAEFEAAQIVAAAKEEAKRLVSEASRPAGIPPEALMRFQATIDGFARMNDELLRELAALNQILAHHVPATTTQPFRIPVPPPTTFLNDRRTPLRSVPASQASAG